MSSLSLIARSLSDDPAWASEAHLLAHPVAVGKSIHLAVFVQPYLNLLLNGQKTVESRFSSVRFPPYGRVARGDIVLLKESGGPVVGVCEVGAAWFYRLDPKSWQTIRREFSKALCAEDPAFWHNREHAAFATLMCVSRARRIEPVQWCKRDRRGWVVLRSGSPAPLFGGSMRNTVLGFAGGIASGKSTISEAISLSLGCSRVSFGGYLRVEARRRGLSTSRESLGALGEELVLHDPDGLCRSVLAQVAWTPGGPLVIDGVRHVEIVARLSKLVVPSAFRIVYITANPGARSVRLEARSEGDADLRTLDSHSTELDVSTRLRQLADLVVNGEGRIEAVIDEVCRWAETLP